MNGSAPPPRLIGLVEEYFRRSGDPGIGRIAMATDLVVAPDGRHVAFTAQVLVAADQAPQRRVAVVALESANVTWPADPIAESYGARWSPADDRLAWVAARPGGAVAEVASPSDGGWSAAPLCPNRMAGEVEFVRWSPDGEQLLLGVAEPGAQLSDIVGSGTVATDGTKPSWYPEVNDGGRAGGGRSVWVYDLHSGVARRVSPTDLNVWQAHWAGPGRLVVITSAGPSESDWYASALELIDVSTGLRTVVPTNDEQLAAPEASPSGRQVSVIAGSMSDRGLDAGRLAVGSATGLDYVDTLGVDVTDQHWVDDATIVFAGLRGMQTVVGRYSVGAKAVVVWETDETCGDYVPQVGAAADTIVACAHSYMRAPELVRLADGAEQSVLDLGHAGTTYVREVAGAIETVRWAGADGTEIEGLLTTPPGPGPFPLIVHVHGGPVWAWRNSWSMHYPYTPQFVGQGFAVLHPNGRGSIGRGQEFVRSGLLDMGGLDATDLVLGVDSLVVAGRVDPQRVAITGNSYGGFMSAWLAATSDRFAAAAARSPVTDWVSQHLASNLPGFDERCLTGDPLDATSPYRSRSPLYLADRVHVPMLFMAGARDLATPPEQASMMHRALTERGRPSTLVIYPEEGHGVRCHDAVVDQCARLLEFFERNLGGADSYR